MKTKKFYLLFPLAALAVGGLSWLLSRHGMETNYQTLVKSALTPPDFVFPLVWSVLYVLMGIGLAIVLNQQKLGAQGAGIIWLMQLGANFLWSPLFFRWQLFAAALVCLAVLWLLVLTMMFVFAKASRTAALLQLPYLVWVAFAGYLNYVVWQMN